MKARNMSKTINFDLRNTINPELKKKLRDQISIVEAGVEALSELDEHSFQLMNKTELLAVMDLLVVITSVVATSIMLCTKYARVRVQQGLKPS